MKILISLFLLVFMALSPSKANTSENTTSLVYEDALQLFEIEADITSIEPCGGGGSYIFTVEVRVYGYAANGTRILIAQGSTRIAQAGCDGHNNNMVSPDNWTNCYSNGVPCPPSIYVDHPELPVQIENTILETIANIGY